MKANAFALSVLAAASCMPEPGGGTTDGPDADVSVADASPTAPDAGPPDVALMLNGTPPVTPRPAPEFTVLNRDGTTRTRADLLGNPTVIWFYPAAFTAG